MYIFIYKFRIDFNNFLNYFRTFAFPFYSYQTPYTLEMIGTHDAYASLLLTHMFFSWDIFFKGQTSYSLSNEG